MPPTNNVPQFSFHLRALSNSEVTLCLTETVYEITIRGRNMQIRSYLVPIELIGSKGVLLLLHFVTHLSVTLINLITISEYCLMMLIKNGFMYV